MIKKLFMLVLVVLCTSVAFSADDYEFKITIDHSFDEDEVECVLEFDGDTDTYTFDEDTDEDDLEIVEEFNDYLDFNCDTDLETIKLYVYDQNGDRVFRETYEDEDKFDYEIEYVDEDEQYFEFEIQSDITSSIDCDLDIDGGDFEYELEFDEDTDSDDLEFAYNFDGEFVLDCDDDIEEIDLTVYDDSGDVIYDKTFYDKKLIEFDIDETIDQNELRIEIDHNFEEDEEVKCVLEIDDKDEDTFYFDYDSDDNDLTIVRDFTESFNFDCTEKLDEITLRVYDELGDKIEQETYDNEDEFEYEFNEGQYDFMIEITNDFDDEVECELTVDDRDGEDLEFDEDSDRSDKRIEDDFNQYITLECEEALEEVEIFVFVQEDDDNGDLLAQKTFYGKSLIEFSYGVEEEEEEVEEEVEAVVEEEDTTITEPEIEDENITEDVNESNLIDNGDLVESDISINASEIENNVTGGKGAVTKSTPPKALGTFAFVVFIVLVIVVLILGARKTMHGKKRKPTKRQDKVDLEYLKERRR